MIFVGLLSVCLISSTTSLADKNLQDPPATSTPISELDVARCVSIVEQVAHSFGYTGTQRSLVTSLTKPVDGVDYYCTLYAGFQDADGNSTIGVHISLTKVNPTPENSCNVAQRINSGFEGEKEFVTFHDYDAIRTHHSFDALYGQTDMEGIDWCMFRGGSSYYVHIRPGSNSIELYGYAQDPIPMAEMLLSLMVFEEEQLISEGTSYADITVTTTPTITPTVFVGIGNDSGETSSGNEGFFDSVRIADVMSNPIMKTIGIGLFVLAGLVLGAGLVIVLAKALSRSKVPGRTTFVSSPGSPPLSQQIQQQNQESVIVSRRSSTVPPPVNTLPSEPSTYQTPPVKIPLKEQNIPLPVIPPTPTGKQTRSSVPLEVPPSMDSSISFTTEIQDTKPPLQQQTPPPTSLPPPIIAIPPAIKSSKKDQ